MIRRRLLLLPAAVGLHAAAAPALRAEAPLDALMRGFAARRANDATFTEEKTLPELDEPLRSSGTLSWRAPDRLEKHTTEPVEEMLRVEGDRLTIARQGAPPRTLSLDQAPEIRPLVEAIRATLAGDLATLRRYYAVEFSGAAPEQGWTMVLIPLSARVRAAVQRITLAGRGAAVLSVETQQGGGFTRMRIGQRR